MNERCRKERKRVIDYEVGGLQDEREREWRNRVMDDGLEERV